MDDDRETPPSTNWEELVAYVRSGGRLPDPYPEGYDGNRTTLVGAGRPATPEELVLYIAESREMTEEEHQDPERVLAMLRRCGGDVVWDYEAGEAVPRPLNDLSP